MVCPITGSINILSLKNILIICVSNAMQNLIYRIKHPESNSLAITEFSHQYGKIKIVSCKLLQGNVIDLNAFRLQKLHAENYFHHMEKA